MPVNFSGLPSEIRNRIYEDLLVLPEPIAIEIATESSRSTRDGPLPYTNNWFLWGISGLFPAILLTNKSIYHEAAPLLYSMNCFRVGALELPYTYETPCATLTFLRHIGSQNASYLRHICIPFPRLDDCHVGRVTLQENSIRSLELICNECTSLATLETSLKTTTAMEHFIDSLDSPRAIAEALALADTRFKAISSLKEILVNVYDEAPSLELRDKMRGCGWTIKVTEWEASDDDKHSGPVDYDEDGDDHNYNYESSDEGPRDEENWWEDYDRRKSY